MIGVNLTDTNIPARMFKMLKPGLWHLANCPDKDTFTYFEPLDSPGTIECFRISDFWPLIDSL